jgi:ABC-type antimicrobial peptide transport system permease subunit
VAVLAGALLVGDSVRASLRNIFVSRLGKTDYIISANGFFRERLAEDLKSSNQFAGKFGDACPLIVFEGIVRHDESGRRAGGVQVYGVDDRFWNFHAVNGIASINTSDVMLSDALAQELGSKQGDTLLLTIEKPSAIPSESLHGRKDETGRTLRLNIREQLSQDRMGEFSVRPQQGPVRAVFVSLSRLQRDLEQQGKANAILVSEKTPGADTSASTHALESTIREVFSLEDLGIRIRPLEPQQVISIESDSALISNDIADEVRETASKSGLITQGILSYLANKISDNDSKIPYSLVAAVERSQFDKMLGLDKLNPSSLPPMVLNEWAASDMNARVGDVIEIEYYLWKDEGRLATEKARFELRSIVPIAGFAADKDMVPDYPGITETESMSDWDPPFPVDLGSIRKQDEDYWDNYRTTPKAFIALEDGQKLWQSRFGKLTSIRLIPSDSGTLDSALNKFSADLRATVDPLILGLTVYPARAEGLEAAQGATDFGQYFVYFSFFLVVSALMLAALFFKLGIEQRLREVGLLRAIGFPPARIRSQFLKEGILLSAIGSLIGVLLAIGYGQLMVLGLTTWWVGAVGTTQLKLHISPASLSYGALGGVIAAIACIWWTLRSLAKSSPRSLLMGSMETARKKNKKGGTEQITAGQRTESQPGIWKAFVFGAIGIALIVLASMKLISQVAGFFSAGTSLLVAALFYESSRLRRRTSEVIQGRGFWPVSRLGFRNISYKPGRSVLCIALIASATFIIVAVDSFRRDEASVSMDRKSGTGGFPLQAESVLPLISNPNTEEGRESLNLILPSQDQDIEFTMSRFRLRPGEDTSCLNLYSPQNPRILAPAPDFIESNRFAFQSSLATTDAEKQNPWLLLDRHESDDAVPVIADANSLAYVLHLGLGDVFTLNRSGASPVRMRVVAALSDSIFQGEMLMSEQNFTRLFPDQEGYRFFLIDAPQNRVPALAARLEDLLADFGFDVTSTAERLASFHQVENTYLSTFQTLGGLGLVLGTLGLATVLLRNVLERRRELALLRAIGYNSSHFTLMVLAENTLLLVTGLLFGTACALLAIAPALLARGGSMPGFSLALLLGFVLVSGLISSLAAVAAALRSPLLSALRAE